MNTVESAIANILRRIYNSPNLSTQSRNRLKEWITLGEKWEFVENFAELLSVAEKAGITASQLMTQLASKLDVEPIPQVQNRFFREVPLPPGLSNQHLQLAMDQTQQMISRINRSLRSSAGSPLLNFIQANSFSGIVSNILTDSLDQISPYKHNHDQQFPDLKNLSNDVGLEMKASNKAWKRRGKSQRTRWVVLDFMF